MKATGIFKVTSWDEKACDEGWDGAKVTRASVTQTVSGDIEGEARVEYLMIYLNGGSATFLVTVRVAGQLDGRSGSFVLEGKGTYADGSAKCAFSVVPGAGSGGLAGLRGMGNYSATHAEFPNVPFTLDYHFE
jgi:hypothetical protein